MYTVATLPWKIQKSHYSTVLFIHTSDYSRYLKRKQTPHINHFFHFFTRLEYQSAIRTSCGRVLLRHGLNFSTAWWTMQHCWSVAKKTGSVYIAMQKVVTLNICCNVACLTFHLPHSTTDSFQSHQRFEECNIHSVRWKSCAFCKVVRWHFSWVVGKGVTVFFFWDNVNNLKYVWIILLKNNLFGFPKAK